MILTTPTALFPLSHSAKDFLTAEAGGHAASMGGTFDLMTFSDRNVTSTVVNEGQSNELQ
jgi:hypothetical protein